MILEKYLQKLQSEEAVGGFAIDSFPSTKKKKLTTIKKPSGDKVTIAEARAMIDLDGTIHKYSKGFSDGQIYDDAFKGAKEVINWLKNKGYEIVIFTTRASKQNAEENGDDHKKQISNVETWLKDHGIYFDRVTAEKISADFYIDDKAIPIENGDWGKVKQTITNKFLKN